MKLISLIVAGVLSFGTTTALAQSGGTTGSSAPAATGAGGATTSAPAPRPTAVPPNAQGNACWLTEERLNACNDALASCDEETVAQWTVWADANCPNATQPRPGRQGERHRTATGGGGGKPTITRTPPQALTSTGPGEANATATIGDTTIIVHPPDVNVTVTAPAAAAPTAARATGTGDGDGRAGRLQLDVGLMVLNVFRPNLPDTFGLGGKVSVTGGIAGPFGLQLTGSAAHGWNDWGNRALFGAAADLTLNVLTFTGEYEGGLKPFAGLEGLVENRTFGSWSNYLGGRLGLRLELGRFVAGAHVGYGGNQIVFRQEDGGGVSGWGKAWMLGLSGGIALLP